MTMPTIKGLQFLSVLKNLFYTVEYCLLHLNLLLSLKHNLWLFILSGTFSGAVMCIAFLLYRIL